MTLGSLFDGSGGFPLAGSLCGIEPVWAAEVEPYPIAVTRSRFPKMLHYGDVSKIKGGEVPPVDVITFGSPCQDLSVAGKRAGLKHTENGDEETTRSGLFMEAVRIIKEMRSATNGQYPRYAVWENVPGAYSSNKGEDFRVVLEELIKIVEPSAEVPPAPKSGWPYADAYVGDGWSLAYRTFDAQYWGRTVIDRDNGTVLKRGTPQRRRRIYLVADFVGGRAPAVLFELEGMRGHLTESRTPWESTSAHAEGSVGADDREGESLGVGVDSYNLCLTGSVGRTVTTASGGLNEHIPVVIQNEPTDCEEAVPYTLKIRSGCDVDANGKSGGKGALIQTNKSGTLSTVQDQYLFQPIAVATQQGGAEVTTNGVCPTVTAAAGMSGNNQPWICTLEPGIAQREGGHIYEGVSGTLRANMGDNQMAVAHPVALSAKQQSLVTTENCANTLGANDYKEPQVVFQPVPNLLLDDQGGQQIGVRTDDKCPTLRAEAHGNMPCVVEAAGFKAGQGVKARSIGWEEEKCPTLAAEAGGNSVPTVCMKCYESHPMDSRVKELEDGISPTVSAKWHKGAADTPLVCYSIENHPADSRVNINESGKVQTLTSRMGTGGGNVPMVCVKTWDARGNGDGDTCSTITGDHENRVTDFTSVVVEQYPFCKSSRAKSADDATTWKEARVANTLNTFDLGEVRANELVVEPIAFAANQRDEVRDLGDKAGALQAQPGMKQQTFIAEPVYCLQGNGIDRADTAGCNGKGWKEDTSYTLNTIDRPAVVYAVDQGGGKSGANVSEDTAPTLYTTHGGEPAVAYSIGNGQLNQISMSETCNTLDCMHDKQAVLVKDETVAFAVDCRNFTETPELFQTLQAKPNGGQSLNFSGAVRVRYIVRRLTPTECARLQGFDDNWGHPDVKTELTDEEYDFWLNVRNLHAEINGKAIKEYTKEQMLTWYNKLHSDSAEYKMWGNGIALPPTLYVMQGIAANLNEKDDAE